MRFLVDMGLAGHVAEWLRNRGHDAFHRREQGLQRLSDEAPLAKATAARRTVLTCDLDFGEILAFSGGKGVSAVVFRTTHVGAAKVIARLDQGLTDCGAALEQGAIVVAEDERLRIRRLPLGA